MSTVTITTKVNELNEEELVARFDQLVDEGVIFFDREVEVKKYSNGDVPFEFRIMPSMRKKPEISSGTIGAAEALVPGSDINVNGFEVQLIGKTHLLTFNMFSAFRPHFLLLTKDGYRRQYESLGIDDFKALSRVLSGLDERQVVLYNGGPEAGCSRFHKHMQIMPCTESFVLWNQFVRDGETTLRKLPFKAFGQAFVGSTLPTPGELVVTYRRLLDKVARALDYTPIEGRAPPHNVIFDKSAIMVIPRRSVGINGAEPNAAGMLGVIWTSDWDRVKMWLDTGLNDVLRAAGIPNDETGKGVQ